MRIISGIRRGHKLFEFEGDDVRPTTDRVKESVFNIILTFIPSRGAWIEIYCSLPLVLWRWVAPLAGCVD